MSMHSSLPGDPSVTFSGIVGATYDAKSFPKKDYIIDGSASVQTKGDKRTLRGYGLAEYFNVDNWST